MTNWCTNMTETITVLFDEDFDAPDHMRASAHQAEVKKISVDDLAACRKEAWDEGFAAGREAGLATLQTDMRINLAEIATGMHTAKIDLMTQTEQIGEELAGLLLAAFNHTLPALCARYGLAEIAAVAAEIVPPMVGGAQLHIQIAPDRVGPMREILARHDADLAENISLIASSKLGSSDIVMRWHQGEAVRDVDAMWRNILAILAPYGLSPTPARMDAATRELSYVE